MFVIADLLQQQMLSQVIKAHLRCTHQAISVMQVNSSVQYMCTSTPFTKKEET